MPISLALAVLPSRLVLVQRETEAKFGDTDSPRWTRLGRAFQAFGFLAGVALYASVRAGS
jgi:hypothetical protein